MTLHITDASAFGPLLFPDERETKIAGFDELIFRGECIVPRHWRLEVTNQLLMGLRRKRMTEGSATELLTMLDALPIQSDPETDGRMVEIYSLALRYHLTIYDAAYLELAIRIEGVLVTFDKKLKAAATKCGIVSVP